MWFIYSLFYTVTIFSYNNCHVKKVECIEAIGVCKIHDTARKDIWGRDYDLLEVKKIGQGYSGFMGPFKLSVGSKELSLYGIDFKKEYFDIDQEISLVCKN